MFSSIRMVYQLIKTRYFDLKSETYLAFHNTFILKNIWILIYRGSFSYWIYKLFRLVFLILYNVGMRQIIEYDIFMIIFDQIMLIPILINQFCIKKMEFQQKPLFINILLFLLAFATFIICIFQQLNQEGSPCDNRKLLIIIIFQIITIPQRYFSIRLIQYFLTSIYIYFTESNCKEPFRLEYLFGIITILCLFHWHYDTLMLDISKFKQIQKETFQNIPIPCCLMGQDGSEILFLNGQMKHLIINRQTSSLDKSKSLTSLRYLQIQIQDRTLFKDDQSSKRQIDVLGFFQQFLIDADDVLDQLNLSTHKFEQIGGCFNLDQVIKMVSYHLKIQKASFCFRSFVINDFFEDKLNNAYEIRITTQINYAQEEAIFITISDISKHLKALYYRNMNQFKSKLIKSISHELRTRLNIIQGMIEMILNNHKSLNDEQSRLLKISYNNCKIQAHIVGSIINYNLIQENQIQQKIKFCKLKHIIEEVYGLFEEEAKLKNIQFKIKNSIPADEKLDIDRERLMDCLVNLIANSIKFTQKSGEVTIIVSSADKISFEKAQNTINKIQSDIHINLKSVRCSVLKKQVSFKFPVDQNPIYYKIQIIDNGIGISQDKKMKIEQILANDEPIIYESNDSSEGFMIGIRIVSSILNYLNQSKGQWLTIESEKDEGTKVTMYLKSNIRFLNQQRLDSIEQEQEIQEIKQNFYRNQLSSRLFSEERVNSLLLKQNCSCEQDILIVDDELYNLLVLEKLFKICGQNTIKAENGFTAMKIVEQRIQIAKKELHNCCVLKAIFMDYQMPIMNGKQGTIEIIKLFMENQMMPVPIIGCTGFSAKEDIQELLTAGMIEVIIKPVTVKVIEKTLKKIELRKIKKQQLEQEQQNFLNENNFSYISNHNGAQARKINDQL